MFEFPVQIWVMCEALATEYSSGYGELRFNVALPTGMPPFGGAPDVPGIASHIKVTGDQVVWAQEYGAFVPESLRPATALHRVVMTDVDGPIYDHASWFTPDNQLAEYVEPWFNEVRTWVEVMTGQDLDPNHRVYDAELVGVGLTFIEPPHNGSTGMKITTPRIRPLRAQEWADILGFVRDGKQPPLEEVLSRDARAAQRRHANRRAIIDAATALEIALGRYIRGMADQLPPAQQGRLDKQPTLGAYISIAENSGLQLAVPIERLQWLSRLRNDAAHRGEETSDREAVNAVQVMLDFLGTHGLITRTGELDSDGSEWTLVDSENLETGASGMDSR